MTSLIEAMARAIEDADRVKHFVRSNGDGAWEVIKDTADLFDGLVSDETLVVQATLADHGEAIDAAAKAQNLYVAQAALTALQESGYVVVPVEPTQDMTYAALQHPRVGSQLAGLGERDIEEAYSAMLKAVKGETS